MRDVRRYRLIVPALALALSALALGGPAPVSATGQVTVLAQAQDIQLPEGDLLFKVTAFAVPAGQASVTHAHLSGFDYSRAGTHVQITGGQRRVVGPGQAAYIDTGVEHTHAALDGAAFTFWFVSVRPEAQRGVPPVWPYPGARILWESAAFRVPPGGAWAEVLSEVRLAGPGDAVAGLSAHGPVGLVVLEGQVTVGGQVLQAEGAAVQPQGDPGPVADTGTGGARVLAIQVVPTGLAPGLPNTGAGGAHQPQAGLWLALLIALLTALVGLGTAAARRAAR
jgi:hypothetical protein